MFRYVGDEARHRVNLWSSTFEMIRWCLLLWFCVVSDPRMPWLVMSMMGCQCHRCAGSEIEWPWVRVLSAGPCLCCCLEWDTGQLTAEASRAWAEPAAAPRHKSGMRGRKGETGQGARRRRRKAGGGKGCECWYRDTRPDPAPSACVLFPDQKAPGLVSIVSSL